MVASALIVTFVSSFIAIVGFGHVLLIGAIWPDLWGKRRRAPRAADTESTGTVTLPNEAKA